MHSFCCCFFTSLLQDTTTQLVYEYWLSSAAETHEHKRQEIVCMEKKKKKSMNVLLLGNSSKRSSRCVRCHSIPFIASTDCVCAPVSAWSTRLAAAFTYTQDTEALMLHRSSTRFATDDAYLFTPPGVFVCMAVDVLKLPFEFDVRWCERIARCMALRTPYKHKNWILLRWRCPHSSGMKLEMKNLQKRFIFLFQIFL